MKVRRDQGDGGKVAAPGHSEPLCDRDLQQFLLFAASFVFTYVSCVPCGVCESFQSLTLGHQCNVSPVWQAALLLIYKNIFIFMHFFIRNFRKNAV